MPKAKKGLKRILAVFQVPRPDYKRPYLRQEHETVSTRKEALDWIEAQVGAAREWCQLPKLDTLDEFIDRVFIDGYMDERYMSAWFFDGNTGELVHCDKDVDRFVTENLGQTGGRCRHPECVEDRESEAETQADA